MANSLKDDLGHSGKLVVRALPPSPFPESIQCDGKWGYVRQYEYEAKDNEKVWSTYIMTIMSMR